MINLNNINLGSINLGGMNTSEIKLGYPSSDSPVPGLKGLQGLYMGKGLTNEMMSRDPVWRDRSGNGNHIQLKNFAWAEKSGVGMYAYNFNTNPFTFAGPSYGDKKYSDKIVLRKANGSQVNVIHNKPTFKCKLKVSGLTKAIDRKEVLRLRIYNSLSTSVSVEFKSDGIYDIDLSGNSGNTYIFLVGVGTIANPTTPQEPVILEQIPTYENALCFDGVDDYGICETFPIFTKEKGYTVMALRKWISREPQFVNLVTNTASWGVDGAFSLEYKNGQTVLLNSAVNFGSANGVDLPYGALTYQTSESYNGVAIKKGERIGTNTVLLGRSAVSGFQFYSSFALYALAIIDHDTTAEERQLVIDYWKREYPELFPDQAWTVTGKTNSDADKATIKNITGNGNDLMLTNFGFTENSGYGKWPFTILPMDIFVDQPYGTGHYTADIYGQTLAVNLNYVRFKFRIREMQEGGSFSIRAVRIDNHNVSYKDLTVNKDGVYEFEYENPDELFHIMCYNGWGGDLTDFYVDILQDPDYEGYLLTDGVDDQIVSSEQFKLSKDYTIVGDWKYLDNKYQTCGVIYSPQFYVYNNGTGVLIYINSGSIDNSIKNTKSLKAVSSDGRVYDENWNEITVEAGVYVADKSNLMIGARLPSTFAPMAFKNLAIYPGVLTKEQCIRAYNYLQTIKNV